MSKKREKRTIETFKKIAEEHGGKCLSISYKRQTDMLEYICAEGHEFTQMATNTLYAKQWCDDCRRHPQHTIEEMQAYAVSKGGICVSEPKDKINAKTKLKYRCANNHEFEQIVHKTLNAEQWCKKCAKNAPLSIEYFQNLAKERKGECLSTTYVNKNTKLTYRCEDGHIFDQAPGNTKNGFNWCPDCSVFKCEKWMKQILELLFDVVFVKIRPEWLRNPLTGRNLELDMYNDLLKIAGEYNGKQHYEVITYFHKSEEDLLDQQRRDQFTIEGCTKNNVHLIIVNYRCNTPQKIFESILEQLTDAQIDLIDNLYGKTIVINNMG